MHMKKLYENNQHVPPMARRLPLGSPAGWTEVVHENKPKIHLRAKFWPLKSRTCFRETPPSQGKNKTIKKENPPQKIIKISQNICRFCAIFCRFRKDRKFRVSSGGTQEIMMKRKEYTDALHLAVLEAQLDGCWSGLANPLWSFAK